MSQGQTSFSEQVSAEHPKRIHPHQDKDAISLGDESALSWYFGQGLSIYDKSTFGAVLQRITLDGFSSGPCATCAGDGILDVGGFAVSTVCQRCKGVGKPLERRQGEAERACSDCRGSGSVEPYEVKAERGGWCDSCRGSGCTAVARRSMRAKRCETCEGKRRGVDDRQCADCLGTGAAQATALPMTQADSGAGVIPDDSALTRFAITSRRLSGVRKRSAALYSALECYYGDVGARWGREDFGRIFALYALTPSGKRLARWAEKTTPTTQPAATPEKKKAPKQSASWVNPVPVPAAMPFVHSVHDLVKVMKADKIRPRRLEKIGDFTGPRRLNGSCSAKDPMLMGRRREEAAEEAESPFEELSAQQRIWSQVAAEKRQPKRERSALLTAANKQAQELLDRALAAWNEAGGVRPDRSMKRLAKRMIQAGMLNLGTHVAVQAAGR